MQTIPVMNAARRPVDLEGGQVLAPGERGDAPDTPHTRAYLADETLIALDPVKPPTVEQLREQAAALGHDVPAKATKTELEALIASGPPNTTTEGGDA